MRDFIVYICSVSAIGGMLVVVWKICEAKGFALWRKSKEDWNVFTMNKDEADYWHGKEGTPATAAIKKRVYIRDKNKCRECGCGVLVGNATTKTEHIQALFQNHKPGNIHHIVPEAWGGTAYFRDGKPALEGEIDLEMFAVLCHEHNQKIKDDVRHPWTIEFCKRRRLKIYLERPFESSKEQ